MNLTEAAQLFIEDKKLTAKAPSTISDAEFRVNRFVKALCTYGVQSSDEITKAHVTSYRTNLAAHYNNLSAGQHTRIVKAFLKFVDREDLADFKNPRQTDEDRERRLPVPFSDEEIKAFLAVADARAALLFRAQIATGLAIVDMLSLQPSNLRDGTVPCIVTRRQKTRAFVCVPISRELWHELSLVLPFYSGKLKSGVAIWGSHIRMLQQKAGIWRKGSLTHRCRKTFVDRHLAAGTPLATLAALMGDTVSVVEAHYTNLQSQRMQEQALAAQVITI